MKILRIVLNTLVILLGLLIVKAALGQEIPQIDHFQMNVILKQDGTVALVADFYSFEDWSGYLGSGSIAYDCATGEYYLDEIVDVQAGYVNQVWYDADQIATGIEYHLNEWIVFSTTDDWANIYPEWQPEGLYNLALYGTPENRQVLETYAGYQQTCVTYSTYLPLVMSN